MFWPGAQTTCSGDKLRYTKNTSHAQAKGMKLKHENQIFFFIKTERDSNIITEFTVLPLLFDY
jgi:hypothetical protein